MFTEPDTISMFCVYVFSFHSITPLCPCPYYVCSNPIMIIFDIFSMDGHHLAFYMTEHNYSVFAIRNKAALMQIYLAIYMALHNFFLARFARSVFKTLIKCIVQSGTSTKSMYYIVLPY